MSTRWKRDWDAFRTDVYKANRDFRHFAKTTVHDVANTVGQGDTELDTFVDRQFNKNTGLIYKRTPGNKRQKLMKYSRSRTRGRSRARTRSRRPLRRIRRFSRKPSSRRPRSKSRMKGLRSMIKRVAMEAVEPKRYVKNVVDLEYPGFPIWWNLTTIPTDNIIQSFSEYRNAAQGFKVYVKGIRIKGWIYNQSQLPLIGNMWLVENIRGLNAATAGNLAVPPAGQNTIMWHNPDDGRPAQFAQLSKLNQLTPTLSRFADYKVKRRQVFKLNSTRRTNTAGTDTGGDEAEYAEDDTSDTMHFDWWIPLNKNYEFLNINEGDGSRLRLDLFFGFTMNPHTTDVSWDTRLRPRYTFDHTIFYKDA